jgi:hypothetical protein
VLRSRASDRAQTVIKTAKSCRHTWVCFSNNIIDRCLCGSDFLSLNFVKIVVFRWDALKIWRLTKCSSVTLYLVGYRISPAFSKRNQREQIGQYMQRAWQWCEMLKHWLETWKGRAHLVDLGVDRASMVCILNRVWGRALIYLAWQTIVMAVRNAASGRWVINRLDAATFVKCGLFYAVAARCRRFNMKPQLNL